MLTGKLINHVTIENIWLFNTKYVWIFDKEYYDRLINYELQCSIASWKVVRKFVT